MNMIHFTAEIVSDGDNRLVAWLDYGAESNADGIAIARDWAKRRGGAGYYCTVYNLDVGECIASYAW